MTAADVSTSAQQEQLIAMCELINLTLKKLKRVGNECRAKVVVAMKRGKPVKKASRLIFSRVCATAAFPFLKAAQIVALRPQFGFVPSLVLLSI